MRVDFDAERLSAAELQDATRRFGAELEGVYQHAMWRVGGLDCPDCARTLSKSIEMVPGVVSAELNFASAMLLVEHDAGVGSECRDRPHDRAPPAIPPKR